MADLSHIKIFEIEEDYGPLQFSKVVLFNENRITQEEAMRLVQAGEYNDNVLVIPEKQFIFLFLDGKEG